MATSVGQIGLDLVVNQNGFNKQMQGITGLAKKAGVALASAFAVKKLVDFSMQCINLGSDLEEVQNVVDVTFTTMSDKVNEFAKSAATSFGLSETMAKRYTGTFGAMSKAFGFTESAAYDMSSTLTGLAGDVASFYNISQDEAYTKLKSVFTGETESLKDLGVVMTQTALDQFALTNGFGRTTAKMSEQEKVALRYQFVLDKLSGASGDFLRTQDSWANQTRILSLRFDQLRATIGQGLINVFTPILKVINTVIAKLQVLADSFLKFTQLISGKNIDAGSGIVAQAGAASESVEGIGTSAKKAAKEATNALGGLDELNILSTNADNAGDGMGGISGGTGGEMGDPLAVQVDTSQLDSMSEKIESIKAGFASIGTYFAETFGPPIQTALGLIMPEFINFQTTLTTSFATLGTLWQPFIDAVTTNVVPFLQQFIIDSGAMIAQWMGIFTQVFADIGILAFNLFNWFITDGIPVLTESWTTISAIFFDAMTLIGGMFTDLTGLAFTAFNWFILEGLPVLSQFYLDAVGMFSDLYDSVKMVLEDLWDIVVMPILGWFVSDGLPLLLDFTNGCWEIFKEMFDAVKEIFDTIWEGAVQPGLQLLTDMAIDVLNSIKDFWYEWGTEIVDGCKEVIENIRKTFQKLWKEYLQPIVDNMLKGLKWLWDKHLKGVVDGVLEFVGKLVDGALDIYNKFITPIVNWLIDTFGPTFANIFSFCIDTVLTIVGVIADVAKGILKSLGGVIDFIVGVFTLDWEKAWGGIKDIFAGIFDAIVGVLKGAINLIIDGINFMIRQLNKVKVDVPDWLATLTGFSTIGFSVPEIPKLAQGGYVKANTPQLAMIGDNKRYGEIVAPENKLEDMALLAAKLASQNGNGGLSTELLYTIIDLLKELIATVLGLELSSEISGRDLVTLLESSKSRSGISMSRDQRRR